ncbi:phage P2 GpU family protein [Campylobacter blaseri]|uniref:Oxidoreductase n=1 Tax=Campylobacter blaseri TaxID=2042961 RepID=A0A2P8QYP9_9BACT|nr:phage tail protein [Campylobacter blaseri]PSM51374.1 oxidoreductase [Campylobacter blaseri]PSM52824.1 oxidoreductase [Campylobacter blaseri]QKF86125.1 phage P2 GpU family protein [Campylobacter blaseri]
MVLVLGGYEFSWQMINNMGLESEFGLSENERVANYPSLFRANLGKQNITLNCKTLPFAKHGNSALKPLYDLASLGLSYPLVSGNGEYFGRFVIEKISENRAIFTKDGHFFTQTFNLTLKRDYDI